MGLRLGCTAAYLGWWHQLIRLAPHPDIGNLIFILFADQRIQLLQHFHQFADALLVLKLLIFFGVIHDFDRIFALLHEVPILDKIFSLFLHCRGLELVVFVFAVSVFYYLLLVLLLRLGLNLTDLFLDFQTILVFFGEELCDVGLLPQSLCLLFLFLFEFPLLFGQFKLLFHLDFFQSLLFFQKNFVLAGLLLRFELCNLIQPNPLQLSQLLLFLLFSLELCLDFLLLLLFKLQILLPFGLKFLGLFFCFDL